MIRQVSRVNIESRHKRLKQNDDNYNKNIVESNCLDVTMHIVDYLGFYIISLRLEIDDNGARDFIYEPKKVTATIGPQNAKTPIMLLW